MGWVCGSGTQEGLEERGRIVYIKYMYMKFKIHKCFYHLEALRMINEHLVISHGPVKLACKVNLHAYIYEIGTLENHTQSCLMDSR